MAMPGGGQRGPPRANMLSFFTAAVVVGAVRAEVAVVDTARMWAELHDHCGRGLCLLHSGSQSKLDKLANTTDCKGRMLAYEFGLKLIPARAPQREVFDALELEATCGVTPPSEMPVPPVIALPAAALTVYVDGTAGSDGPGAGARDAPFRTVARALAETRKTDQEVAAAPGSGRTIVLRAGMHFIGETVRLGAQDSGLLMTADPEDAKAGRVPWVSGGTPVKAAWRRWGGGANASANIWVTDVVGVDDDIQGLNTLALPPGREGTHRRATRARYPDGDIESCSGAGAGRCWNNGIKHWHKDLRCVGKARTVYMDLRHCDDQGRLVGGGGAPCKNDSAMWDTYNTYSNGHGGCCEIWSGDESPFGPMGDYFCGNSSAGGWVGFDDPRGQNRSQGLSPAMPVGFDYDAGQYPLLASMDDPAGGIMHVWRDQGWFVNMFEVASHNASDASVAFTMVTGRDGTTTHVKGGWQGGRGWQVNASAINSTRDDPHDYLLAGKWMIENVKEALDAPNEFWFDRSAKKLYLWPNGTTTAAGGTSNNTGGAPEGDYVAVVLDTLVSINATKADPATNITLRGLGFRDAADITMKPWGVPSGGDWGLYRGGAVFIEGCEGCAVEHCTFERVDGNGIFVSGYTRHVTLSDNEFAWIGDSAMAAWGYTKENDGTDGQQPRFTSLLRNYVREIGLIEKQSSAWFQAKTCQTIVEDNIIMNGPRAGINFNDGFGGGTNVTNNLIFNQCRESGDHGPINSWDRTAYISDVATGEPSYAAQLNNVVNNMIIANYGSSQGFDTDDGSSWYNISDNFFFMADAWKMDYGGHDSFFTNNLIYHGHNDGQNCVNTWPFLPEHGAVYQGNQCILPASTNIGNLFHGCQCPGTAHADAPWTPGSADPQSECGVAFSRNAYFTENGTATVSCGNKPTWDEWQHQFGNDEGSTLSGLPSDDQLLEWARDKLQL